ncbi:MAG: glycosyltransferase family 4 protein [Anaerolineae bacterium]
MKSVRYVLDLRSATDHFPGIGRYAVNLARALIPRLDEAEQLLLLRDPGATSRWNVEALAGEASPVIDVPRSPFSLRQQWLLPRLLRHLEAAVYHSPYHLMPYRPGVPSLVTVHDLIPLRYPHYFTPLRRLVSALAVRLASRAARRLIVDSQATADDLQHFLGLPPERIAVIPLAADPTFRPAGPAAVGALRDRLDLPQQYVLYLGSNKPHKNLARLVEAWQLVQPQPLPLLIAGVWDPRYPQARQRAEALDLGQAVRFLGPVPEDDLPALYSGATLFVFPSEYEGFGLPVLEAMACGAPVVCARTSSLPEVAGQAALFFDPADPQALAGTIRRALADPALRADLAGRGRRQAETFSWARTARQTLQIYRVECDLKGNYG